MNIIEQAMTTHEFPNKSTFPYVYIPGGPKKRPELCVTITACIQGGPKNGPSKLSKLTQYQMQFF